ncbi:flagellar type III secretion system pore protein FliP [Amnibacterium sp.]|uniref:flagellar type III secretion system pore protein FliP n=1 Tax=Amnibacterium sp. TaxID=1872496 RepID=UPI0039C85ECA
MTRGVPATAGPARLPVAARVRAWWPTGVVLLLGVLVVAYLVVASPLSAFADPVNPTVPTPTPSAGSGAVSITIGGANGAPSTSVMVLIGITLLSVAPALLLMMSSFTKIFVVLAMTRNALGLPTIPPNQVLAGLALFLSLFIMWPVLQQVNTAALTPYLAGKIDFNAAIGAASGPLQHFMVLHTKESDIALMTRAAGQANPTDPSTVPLVTLIPAFMLSELRAAFIIGLVIFVPFLVIDLVVSSGLMAMGMMMLPPTMIALPFKILLFVLVDGWGLIITSLVQSYRTG